MNGNCHFMLGIATGTAVAIATGSDIETTTLLISTSMIGSIFPDIDNPNSHFGKLTVPVSTVIGKISKAMGKTKEKHRGIFHDIAIYLIGLFLCIYYFPPLIGFFAGAVSHLILDAFNPSGVPFLFLRRVHLGRIDGNSRSAYILTWVLIVLVIGCAIYINLNGLVIPEIKIKSNPFLA